MRRLLVLAPLMLQACASRDDKSPAQLPDIMATSRDGGVDDDAKPYADTSSENDPLVSSLFGAWRQGDSACSYTNTLDGMGIYTIVSTTGERISALYKLTPPSSAGGRWTFDFTITTDNNVVDCEGDMIDETGASHRAYLDLVDSDHVDVYRDATGGTPAFSWQRI